MGRRHYRSKSKTKNSLKGRRRVKVNLSKRKQRKKGIGRYSSRVKKQLNYLPSLQIMYYISHL